MKIESIKLLQYDRKENKNVDYDISRDEGVWVRYIVSTYLPFVDLSFDIPEGKDWISMMNDISIQYLTETEPSSLIERIHQEVCDKMWEFILHNFPATQDDKDKFYAYESKAGEVIYNALILFYNNLSDEIKLDIKDKNQMKVQEEEICLNDVIKD